MSSSVLVERAHVPIGLLRNIKAHAIEAVEFEVCGLLGGEGSYVMSLSRCGNRSSDPRNAFLVPPHQQYKTEQYLTKQGMKLLGIYHSHPTSDPEPSLSDLANIPSEMLSLIYSCRRDEIRAWRGATQVDLEVIR